MVHDIVIRGGLIVDGSGAEPFEGDVAIDGGRIVAVGGKLGDGRREIDATGLVVTPGFVDIHTHYDGQAIWSDRVSPSSSHGVTTVVMGNCGVGFAPCRAADHDLLVDLMAGVEDIPGAVMAEGLAWDWETFPQYLDALESRSRDIDVAAFLPHSPLRVYVMGARGANREAATSGDLGTMRKLAEEATKAGAIGFATSLFVMHRTLSGHAVPTYEAEEAELVAIAEGVRDGGGGLLQMIPDIPRADGYVSALAPIFNTSRRTGLPLTFTLSTSNVGGGIWRDALALVETANASGAEVTAQVFPRPIGLILGLDLTAHPFVLCPTYRSIETLSLAERVSAMRRPDMREKIISELPETGHPLTQMARNWEWIFPLRDDPDYAPPRDDSIAARAARRGVSPEEEAYDLLLQEDGHAILLLALGNYHEGSLDSVGEMMGRDDVVIGLGDGGAHYGMVCDASYTTFMLTYWVRDRSHGRFDLASAVRLLTSRPAELVGFFDRGRIAPGYKADLNVIDFNALRLHRPSITRDLPGGGKRLGQGADGYVATIVSGTVISEQGVATGALPGRLVRGQQKRPVELAPVP